MRSLISFIIGGALGSVVTWKVIEKKYKDLADEEIQSVVEKYNEMSKELSNSDIVGQPEKNIYDDTVELYNGGIIDNIVDEKPKYEDTIFVISPDEFGEAGNKMVSYTYYDSDNILVDENNEIIEQPELIIGDALKHIGDYEDDCVHVRNELLGFDYEILKSEKKYGETTDETVEEE